MDNQDLLNVLSRLKVDCRVNPKSLHSLYFNCVAETNDLKRINNQQLCGAATSKTVKQSKDIVNSMIRIKLATSMNTARDNYENAVVKLFDRTTNKHPTNCHFIVCEHMGTISLKDFYNTLNYDHAVLMTKMDFIMNYIGIMLVMMFSVGARSVSLVAVIATLVGIAYSLIYLMPVALLTVGTAAGVGTAVTSAAGVVSTAAGVGVGVATAKKTLVGPIIRFIVYGLKRSKVGIKGLVKTMRGKGEYSGGYGQYGMEGIPMGMNMDNVEFAGMNSGDNFGTDQYGLNPGQTDSFVNGSLVTHQSTYSNPIPTTNVVNTDVVNTDVVNTDVVNTDVINTDVINTDVINTDVINTDVVNTDINLDEATSTVDIGDVSSAVGNIPGLSAVFAIIASYFIDKIPWAKLNPFYGIKTYADKKKEDISMQKVGRTNENKLVNICVIESLLKVQTGFTQIPPGSNQSHTRFMMDQFKNHVVKCSKYSATDNSVTDNSTTDNAVTDKYLKYLDTVYIDYQLIEYIHEIMPLHQYLGELVHNTERVVRVLQTKANARKAAICSILIQIITAGIALDNINHSFTGLNSDDILILIHDNTFGIEYQGYLNESVLVEHNQLEIKRHKGAQGYLSELSGPEYQKYINKPIRIDGRVGVNIIDFSNITPVPGKLISGLGDIVKLCASILPSDDKDFTQALSLCNNAALLPELLVCVYDTYRKLKSGPIMNTKPTDVFVLDRKEVSTLYGQVLDPYIDGRPLDDYTNSTAY
jgi:RNA-splicing ligase RtcB